MDPLFEVVEVERVGVLDFPRLQPLRVVREVVIHLLPVENTVYHVAAKQPQLYLIPSVPMDLFVLVNCFEDVGCGGPVCEFQLFEGVLPHLRFVAPLKILDRHFSENMSDLAVDVFEVEMSLHVLLLEEGESCLVLRGLGGFFPVGLVNVGLLKGFGLLLVGERTEEGIRVEDLNLEKVVLGCESFGVGEIGRVVVVELIGALSKVEELIDLEIDLLQLPFYVLASRTHCLFPQQLSP